MTRSLMAWAGSLLLALCIPAWGSEAYLNLHVPAEGRVSGQMRISVEELQQHIAVDDDGNGEVSWAELQPRRADIEAYLARPCAFAINDLAAVPRVTGLSYGVQGEVAQIAADVTLGDAGQAAESITVDCSIDALDLQQHPRMVHIEWPQQRRAEGRIDASTPRAVFEQTDASRDGFGDFVVSGVWHIWIGYDHILFLIALLIPSVMQRRGQHREPVTHFTTTLWRVAIIVTAFTVTHSITLSLAMLGWVELPPRLVEAAIALSVAIAALYNLLPRSAGATGAWIAAAFGLLHGFGFANVFEAVDTGGQFWTALLGFNLGVECGQLAIVLVFVPLAFWLRRTSVYRVGVVYGGSTAVALLALAWMVERIAG